MKNLSPEEIATLTDRYFHGSERYNCAQTVLRIIQEIIDSPISTIQTATAWGGGRSPNGYCGALYALLSQVPEAEHEEVINTFKSEVGSPYCREIRRNNTVPCSRCVITAATIFNTRS